jgi:hypothetical protein
LALFFSHFGYPVSFFFEEKFTRLIFGRWNRRLLLSLPPVDEQFVSLINQTHCGVEQLVARWAHNPKVVGSSPAPATKSPLAKTVNS